MDPDGVGQDDWKRKGRGLMADEEEGGGEG